MHVLLLGGTGEARRLAGRLVESGVEVTTSLAGAVQHPVLPPGAVRTGGFDGASGLAAYLRATRPALVVDATHPFAAIITEHAATACAITDTRLLVLRRPGWSAGPDDRWTRVPTVTAAAAAVRASPPGTVLLTTGRRDLAAFVGDDRHAFVARSIDPPGDPIPPRTTVLLERGPFDLAGELSLLRTHEVVLLVTKDSGGSATAPKLVAARQLSVPVVIVDRPALPAGVVVVDSVDAVLDQLPDR